LDQVCKAASKSLSVSGGLLRGFRPDLGATLVSRTLIAGTRSMNGTESVLVTWGPTVAG
jgi:hypothetical protein